jgi:O-antigen/teichoic acid export membrane protein
VASRPTPVAETPPPSLVSRAARGTLWLALNSWLSKGMQSFVLLIVAHELAPRDLGLLSVAGLIMNIAAMPGFGLYSALTYRRGNVPEAARTALTIQLVVGTSMTVAAWVLAPTLAGFFHSPNAVGVLRAFAIVIACYAAADIPLGLMVRELDFRRRFVPDVTSALVGGGLSIALVLAGRGVAGVVVGQVVQAILMVALYWLVGVRVRPGWNRLLAAELVGYASKISGGALLQVVVLNIDYIIIGRVLGPGPLGLYSLAFRLCYLPYLAVTIVINGVAFPYYCRLTSRQEIGLGLIRVSGIIALATVPLFTLLGLLAGHIVLVGDRWAPAAGPLRVLALYGILLSLGDSALFALRALGRAGLGLALKALHLVVAGTLIGFTASRGITVVAVDQLLAAGFIAAISFMFVYREAGVRMDALAGALVPAACGAMAMTGAVMIGRLVPGLANPHSGLSLLLLAALAGAAYLCVAGSLARRSITETWSQLRMVRAGSASPEARPL